MAKYMFSEVAGLLCRVTYKYKYWVVNGASHGTRKGDDFIAHTPIGDRPYPSGKITDWVEVYPRYWSLEWQKAWYYGR